MFSISIMGQKQKYLEKEASIEKLKGNIKAISFYEQYYKDNKLVLDQFCGKMNYNNRLLAGLTYCNYKGEITGYSKLFYDANSKLIEKIRIKTLGEIESITKYKYDQKGFIKEELIYEKNINNNYYCCYVFYLNYGAETKIFRKRSFDRKAER